MRTIKQRQRPANLSCGLLMYSMAEGAVSVLLVHPGGPYWRGKDLKAWSIPKGLPEPGEDLLAAAQREFFEETGLQAQAPFSPLTPIRQKGGKIVHCWAFRGDAAPVGVGASQVEIEWPPRSGKRVSFPEIDDAQLFDLATASEKILPAQLGFLLELEALLAAPR